MFCFHMFFISEFLFTLQVQRCICRTQLNIAVPSLLWQLCTITYFVEILKLPLLNYFSLNNSIGTEWRSKPVSWPPVLFLLSCSRHRSAAQSVSAQLEWSGWLFNDIRLTVLEYGFVYRLQHRTSFLAIDVWDNFRLDDSHTGILSPFPSPLDQ